MPRTTRDPSRREYHFGYRAFTSIAGLSRPLRLPYSFVTPCETSHNPRRQAPWFRLFRVRSPLLTESLLFSLPQGT
ncbi:hypothetical protein BK144_31305 [Paenibacillus sp. FSL R7-0273]|nr:hypothetical protein BK144_31305 [Paenibacillus sp. FSL R7-0273]